MRSRKKTETAQPLSSRRKAYRMQLEEVHQRYAQNKVSVSARVPKSLYRKWETYKQQGTKSTLSDFLAVALAYGLEGDHPYNDPLEGVQAAFEAYMDSSETRRDIAIQMIRSIADANGLPIKIG